MEPLATPFTRLAALAGLSALALSLACGGGSTSAPTAFAWPDPPATVPFAARTGQVLPVQVVSSTGVVTPGNATTGGALTLTYPAAGPAPSIVLDYGRTLGGLPQFQVLAVTGTPTLAATYSESSAFIATGDQMPYLATALEPGRAQTFSLGAPGFVRNRLVQGGERYQQLSLTTPGTSVTLGAVGLDATLAGAAVSAEAAGYFTSSSATLNDIWNAGAYAVEANRIDAFRLPSPWTLTMEGVQIGPSNPAIYQGLAFTDTASSTTFEFRVDRGGIGWTVNATFPSTVQFTLNASDDPASPNTLTGSAGGSFSAFLRAPFTAIPLPQPLLPGTWHTVTTTTNPIFLPQGAGLVTVALDGVTLVAGLDPAAAIAASPLAAAIPTYLALGTSGFFNGEGHAATVRNLSISTLDLTTFSPTSYTRPLTDGDATVLDDFGVGSNAVAVITDGAKRDRMVWSGDMLVAGPTLYCSTGAAEPVQGALTLLSQYVDPNGQVASTLPATTALDATGRLAGPANPWYSLDYSMFFIDDLYDYYLHTGDLQLVGRLWPAVQQELGYLAGQRDAASGLLVTSAATGFTWHPQFDASLAGTAAEFNVDYVRALKHAAALASALGWQDQAGALGGAADAVSAAINSTLFNAATGVYDISTARTGYVAQDANSKAILAGVAPAANVPGILARLGTALATSHGHAAFSADYFTAYNSGHGVVSPYASNWELLARFEQGDTAGAMALIEGTWAGMVAPGSACYSGATWESLDAATGFPVDNSISLAHGWSSGPTAALSKYVLGVRPASAGYQTWLIQPQPGTLGWASGRVPTPYGPIAFSWAQNQGGLPFQAALTVPAGTSGTLALPVLGGAEVVRVNGVVATPARTTLGGVTYLNLAGITPGAYTVTVEAK